MGQVVEPGADLESSPGRSDRTRRAVPTDLGWRRIRAELADQCGQQVNKKLIRSIMAELGISALPARRKARPNLVHRVTTADLVKRGFRREGPNLLWMTDITEHPTREGSSTAAR